MDITAAGQVTIKDTATGSVLAVRNFVSSQPFNYMGTNFEIDGNSNVGDQFTVTTDPNRTGDNRNGLKLIDLANQQLLGSGNGTFAEIYNNEVAKLGSNASAAQNASTAAKTSADSLAAQYASNVGVNMDTEASNLMELQQAYQACAQVMATARQLFNTLLQSFSG
jgi:flagellar hook-associated protein 1 FlgK